MPDSHFIALEPLLNNQERVLGYELRWHGAADTAPDDNAALELVRCVHEHLRDDETASLLGEQRVFVEVTPALLEPSVLALLPAQGTVLILRGDALASEETIAAVAKARAQGYAFSVRDANPAALDKQLLAQLSYAELRADRPDFLAQLQQWRALGPAALQPVARGVTDWERFDACAAQNVFSFAGGLYLTPRPGARARDLNPTQTLILQLMEMVQKNADVKQLESVLKRDAALSYKLLRYINSAGFGLGCEVQSLKHAVTMLGYAPLYRWLGLLLATATTSGYSPVLMQTAVIRGRFAELLGAGFLPKQEAENLFVAGMFSLLDKLLGVPMEMVLEKIQLSEPITQALLTREGIYGPFLAMAEACESDESDLDGMATSLCVEASDVNRAQLSALAWTRTLQL
ncbi:MAG TPA: HDOD domain-containing protein [Noviherbaspirillum sp.]|nr:HDOD domain-containing protein [Noviherbaspirillum sp.]